MAEEKLPNLIVVIADSWRGKDAACLGNPVIQTPSADELAREGVAFSNCFVQNTVCTPSRCSFMTGRYPHVMGRRIQEFKLTADDPVILKELKEKGYYVWTNAPGPIKAGDQEQLYSCLFQPERGSWQPPNFPPMTAEHHLFYSFYRGKSSDQELFNKDDAVIQGAIDFLQNNPPEPFCLYINLHSPHPPFHVDEPYFSMYDRSRLPPIIPKPMPGTKSQFLDRVRERMGLENLTEDELKEILAVYYGMITKVDHAVGRLTSSMKQYGYWDSSAVFLFSDHGEYAGDYCMVEKTQNTFDDSLCKVPLIIKYPASISIPQRDKPVDALVEMLDFYATVAELAKLPQSATHFGRSLIPISMGLTEQHRDAVFCEGGGLTSEAHTHEPNGTPPGMLYWPRISVQNEFMELHGKVVMVRTKEWKYVMRLYEKDELYDLINDPDELHNRIDDESLEAVRQHMKERLVNWYLETSDIE